MRILSDLSVAFYYYVVVLFHALEELHYIINAHFLIYIFLMHDLYLYQQILFLYFYHFFLFKMDHLLKRRNCM